MTSETEHFGLTKLGPDEGIHSGDGKFPSADRDTIDDLLNAALNHVHDGAAAGSADAPTLAPDLTPSSTGGTLPAGTTVHYVYTYTDPETGQTAASPTATYTTSDAVAAPAAPTFSLQSIGGSLPPGQYFYVLTAYQTSSTVETKALNPVSVEIPVGTSTNQVELTLPALDAEATGFNIYRRAPGDTRYYHLDTDAGGTYTDDGSVTPTIRNIPSANTTNGATSIEVAIPGATPSIPAGNTWTIYRSYSTSFLNSYLVNLDENTLTYTDIGSATSTASPPSIGFGSHAVAKIDLTAHVTGLLPGSQVSVDDSGFGNLVGTDAQTLFDFIDTEGVGGGGVEPSLYGGAGTETATLAADTVGFGLVRATNATGTATFAATDTGGLVGGYASTSTAGGSAEIKSDGYGALAMGAAFGTGTDVTRIRARKSGARAMGYARGGIIYANGYGAQANGAVYNTGDLAAGGSGAAAFGYVNRGSMDASGYGSFTHGKVNEASGASARIQATADGAGASGSASASVSGATANIDSNGVGAFAGGFASAGTATSCTIQSTLYAGFSFGHAVNYGAVGGHILANERGSTAFGRAYGGVVAAYGRGSLAVGEAYLNSGVYANTHGSFAFGRAASGYAIHANSQGSFALGFANAADIVAGAVNAIQLGEGTNSVANSISVAGGVRIHGGGAPGTPRNGDIWVASGHIYARSNGVTKNLSNIT